MLKTIPIKTFTSQPISLWAEGWFLLTCGNFNKSDYNTMTVSWGGMGHLWEKPFVMVVVRPTRYTYTFMERYDNFTLSAFPEIYREKLTYLGTRSGRDCPKIVQSGLTPVAATQVTSPAFAESTLVLECRKMYWQDLDAAHFLDPHTGSHYPEKDYHRIYLGEILAVSAIGD